MQTIYSIYFTLFLLFVLINFIQCPNKIRYCRTRPNISDININDTLPKEEKKKTECSFYDPGEADNHLSSQQCSFDVKMDGKIINPYQNFREEYPDTTNLKSVCLKCAACLAVADHINKTFTDFYYEQQSSETCTANNCDCQIIENLCSNGFKNYDLREYKGNRLIAKASMRSKHVNSKMDGNWTRALRDLCKTYVSHMDLYGVLHRLKAGTINFTDYICKGDGVFRDCHNIELKQVEMPHTETGLNIKVCVNCF